MSTSESSSRRIRGVRAPLKSQKLDRTLKELESAFHEWESLSASILRAEDDRRKTALAERSEEEFRKKTKKLLNQLRRQLAEL